MERINKYVGSIILCVVALSLFLLLNYTSTHYNIDHNNNNNNNNNDTYYHSIEDGYELLINGVRHSDVKLSNYNFDVTKKGDHIQEKVILPDVKIENPIMQITVIHSAFSVYLADELIYTYGYEDLEKDQFLGYGCHIIDLPDDFQSKKLRIEYDVSENDAFSSFTPLIMNNAKYYYTDFLFLNRIPLIINILLIVFGVFYGITTAVILHRQIKTYRLLCISSFALFIGIWSMTVNNYFIFVTTDIQIKSLFEYICLYLAPLALLEYFRDDIASCTKILKTELYIIESALIVFILFTFIGHFTNIIHFPDVLFIAHIIMVAIALMFIHYIIYITINKKLRNYELLTSIILMILCYIVDLAKYNISKYTNTTYQNFSSSICIGTLIFVIALFIDFVEQISSSIIAATQKETFEKLAFSDSLTGLKNRRSCEDFMDIIDEEDSQYIIIEFDLNGLKRVNDTLGHEIGDKYIITFGTVLGQTFGDIGHVSRTGGDEFVVIVRGISLQDANELLIKLEKAIAKVNSENKSWNMSTAYGIISKNDDNPKSIRKALKLADEKMYAHKIAMKASRE